MNRKTALLEAIRYIAGLEQTFISGVSEIDRQATGTLEHWSAKDLIAHNAAWKEDMARRLAGATLPIVEDFDAANAEIFASFQNKTWGEVTMYALVVQHNLETAVERLEDEELEGYKPLGWGDETPSWRSIAGTACLHPLVHLSENAIKRGDAEQAVRLHQDALPVLQQIDDSPAWQGSLVYNLACQYALAGDSRNAILQLGEALRLNPDLAAWSQQDSDLASLRDEPAYQDLYTTE
ncbi:MAG TPA: hypothetical protein G4N94_07055 [Caldilineae bacterium]|nr:hypothetical protein [Caldilineae bacterium]